MREFLQQGQNIGCSLARTGLRNADYSLASENERDHAPLHVGGMLKAQFRHCAQQLRVQFQVGPGYKALGFH
jgi:hypothetical protein